jgi:excisionase family DNA binding protein
MRKGRGRTPRLLVAFGETKTLAEWSRDPRCRVHVVTLYKRLDNGIPAEEALTQPSTGSTAPKRITAFGETKSVRRWSKDPRCAVNYSTLMVRLNAGIDPEVAITTPGTYRLRAKPQLAVGMVENVELPPDLIADVERWASTRGVTYGTAVRLLIESGLSGETITLAEAAKRLGITRHSAHELYQRGRISGRKAGTVVLVSSESVDRYAAERDRGASEP